jgi:hypothetical protein
MSGKVIHFEVPADDLERARAFYAAAFGWKLQDMPGMDYTLVSTVATDEQGMPAEPGAINGGMAKRQPPLTSPVITIEVADIDAALQKVSELGGSVAQGSQPVGDMGFAAYINDTEGNTIGLWQSAAR